MSISSLGPLVVREHRPWRLGVIILLILALLATCGWLLFEYGRMRAGFDHAQANKREQLLKDEVNARELEIKELREHSAIMERSSQIDREANTVVKVSVVELQNEILELKEELAFYRNIISPNETQAGIRIQSLKLIGGGEERRYRYNLMLTQVLKNQRLALGRVKVSIDGLQEGSPRRLDIKEIQQQGSDKLAFRFKYFQSLEGEVKLPEDFIPQTVNVDVIPKGRRLQRVNRTFEWLTQS